MRDPEEEYTIGEDPGRGVFAVAMVRQSQSVLDKDTAEGVSDEDDGPGGGIPLLGEGEEC